MDNRVGVLSIIAGSVVLAWDVDPALAMGGAGPPAWSMTLNYCRQTVANKGITDVAKFEAEVKKCFADPVDYPPAYNRPRW
jgi:hypothetical protein